MNNSIKIIIPRYKAKKLLKEQIKLGFKILNSPETSLNLLQRKRNKWKSYTSNLLKQIFNNKTISISFFTVNIYKPEPQNIVEFKKYIQKEINKVENILEELSLYETQINTLTKVKNILRNQYFVGAFFLILSFVLSNAFGLFSNRETNIDAKPKFIKPFYDIEYYKIEMKNRTYQTFDTLSVDIIYQGSKIILNRDFELLEYNFSDKGKFHLGSNNEFEPKLELTETIISNLILDSINNNQKILLQLKRQTIFDGFYAAYFEKTDKKRIGDLKFKFSYKYLDSTIIDTLNTKIYLIK